MCISKKSLNPLVRIYRRVECVLNVLNLRYYGFKDLQLKPSSFVKVNSNDCLLHIYNELFSCDLDGYLLWQNEIDVFEPSISDLDKNKRKHDEFLYKNNFLNIFVRPLIYKESVKYYLLKMNIPKNFLWIQYFTSMISLEYHEPFTIVRKPYTGIRCEIHAIIEKSIMDTVDVEHIKDLLCNENRSNFKEYNKIEAFRKECALSYTEGLERYTTLEKIKKNYYKEEDNNYEYEKEIETEEV